MIVYDIGFAVGVAGMVDEAGGVPGHVAVDIVFIVQGEDIDRPLFAVPFLR